MKLRILLLLALPLAAASLPGFISYAYTQTTTKVLPGKSSTDCNGQFNDADILGDVAIILQKYGGSCWGDGRYNNLDYETEQGTYGGTDGSSAPAYRIHPASTPKTQWVASHQNIYIKEPADGTTIKVLSVEADGSLTEVMEIPGSATPAFVNSGIRISSQTSPVTLVLADSAMRISNWPLVGGIEAAFLSSVGEFKVSARRYKVPGHAFIPQNDFQNGPGDHASNYHQPKKFFPVERSDGKESVMWQDQGTGDIYLTTFCADLLNATSTLVVSGASSSDALALAVSNGVDELIMIIASTQGDYWKSVAAKAEILKANSYTGQIIFRKTLPTDKGHMDMYNFHSSGASGVWDRATNKIGLCFARTMTKGSDGLNHQGAIFLVFDGLNGDLQNLGQTSSHSFGNSVVMGSDGNFLGMDLGDNFPRGINVWRKSPDPAQHIANKVVYTFKTKHATSAGSNNYPVYPEISDQTTTYYKWSNDNNIYTEIAHPGLVEASDGLLVFFAGEKEPLDNSEVGKIMNVPRNLAFVKVSQDLQTVLSSGPEEKGGFYSYFGSWTNQTNKGVTWLTSNTAIEEAVSRIKSVRVEPGKILLLWELFSESDYQKSQAMLVDDNGAPLSQIITWSYPVRLSLADDAATSTGQVVFYAGAPGNVLTRYEFCVTQACGMTVDLQDKVAKSIANLTAQVAAFENTTKTLLEQVKTPVDQTYAKVTV